MSTLLVALLSFFGFYIAYFTYGRFIARKLFQIDMSAKMPSETKRDDVDFVPTNRFVLFGHHFTSIAGTGPIVGPAIAVMWGWLPALLWVIFGSIFIGAVHDLTALILSVRNQGQTLGDVTGKILSPSARTLFLILLAFILVIVVAVFANVIATLFALFPNSVFAVWSSLPIAVVVGLLVYRFHWPLLFPALASLVLLYAGIIAGTYLLPPIEFPSINPTYGTPVILWTLVLLVYCFFASVLPVWLLLQPRDYINSQQLYLAMLIIMIGLFYSAATGRADIVEAAPALRVEEANQAGAPAIFPFLFITVACGAVSGFHALVSSGTTSKQIRTKKDAQFIGYGAMLLEGALAVIVIIACTAGIGMEDKKHLWPEYLGKVSGPIVDPSETPRSIWYEKYGGNWNEMNLGKQVGVFVEGGANFMESIAVPHELALGIMAVLIVSFAATTIDTATRLLRYVLQELGLAFKIEPLRNKYFATMIGVVLSGLLALSYGPGGYGTGGMLIWPLFGSANQLIAGLTLMVGAVYLHRRGRGAMFLGIPAVIMLLLPFWAMLLGLFTPEGGWWDAGQYHLVSIGIAILLLGIWLMFEAVRAWRKKK